MGHSRYSAEDRKANQDAHEARMAQFEKSEAGTKARREQSEQPPDNPEGEPEAEGQQGQDQSGAALLDQSAR